MNTKYRLLYCFKNSFLKNWCHFKKQAPRQDNSSYRGLCAHRLQKLKTFTKHVLTVKYLNHGKNDLFIHQKKFNIWSVSHRNKFLSINQQNLQNKHLIDHAGCHKHLIKSSQKHLPNKLSTSMTTSINFQVDKQCEHKKNYQLVFVFKIHKSLNTIHRDTCQMVKTTGTKK